MQALLQAPHYLRFTIITALPNQLMATLHDRMPFILVREEYFRWLEPGDPSRLPVDLLRPYPEEEMVCWPVGKSVGNVRNDAAELIQEVASDKNRFGKAQQRLFLVKIVRRAGDRIKGKRHDSPR